MSLIDEIKIKSLSDAQEILKSAGTEDILDFEKAHKDGDLHPNGKYVWVSSANGGRGDWRTLNGRIHKKHQATIGGGASSSAVSSTTGASSKKDNSSTKTTVVSKRSSKPDFSKLKSWAEPFVKLFNEPENLKSIAKTIDYIDMNKPMKVSKIGSRDSKVFLLRYINKSGVPQVEYFSYNGSSAPGMYGWSANAAVKKIFEQNADVLPPLKIDSSGNVLGIKMVDNNSKTTISDGGKKKMINAKTNVKVVPDTYTIRGNRSSRKMDALYKEMDEKYKDYSREDLQKLKDSFDKKRTIRLAIDRYKRLTKQGASKIAINKEGNLCDELTARYYTINRLLATEDVTNDVDNSKTTSSKSKKSSVKVDIDTIDQDEYNRMYKQAKSVDKQGRSMGLSVITSNINKCKKDLEETISNRPGAKATIKKLQDNLTKFLSQKKAVEDVVGEIDNSKSNKTSKTETYSHDINGVSVSVSKNKDGSYTLEANGKKVKSDDPSFFKDKLTPRVKKALAKEVGIDVKNPTKQFDVKQIGDFISSIKTTHGVVKFIPKNGAIYLVGKRDDYIGDCDEEEKTIELRQDALSNVKRDREAIREISDALQEKFGFVRKITYKENPKYHLKKAYMKIVLKPSK